jgi:hypothetical protein
MVPRQVLERRVREEIPSTVTEKRSRILNQIEKKERILEAVDLSSLPDGGLAITQQISLLQDQLRQMEGVLDVEEKGVDSEKKQTSSVVEANLLDALSRRFVGLTVDSPPQQTRQEYLDSEREWRILFKGREAVEKEEQTQKRTIYLTELPSSSPS